jgi:hypothetical protein
MDANSRTLVWGTSNSGVIMREVFHKFLTTAEIMESSLAVVIGVPD